LVGDPGVVGKTAQERRALKALPWSLLFSSGCKQAYAS